MKILVPIVIIVLTIVMSLIVFICMFFEAKYPDSIDLNFKVIAAAQLPIIALNFGLLCAVMTLLSHSDMLQKGLHHIKECRNIQCEDGNWNHDPYMHGLANGIILTESILLNENPKFLDAPKKWGRDKSSTSNAIGEALTDTDLSMNLVERINLALSEANDDEQREYRNTVEILTSGIDELISDIKAEIEARPDFPNIGKKGCLARLVSLKGKVQ